MPEIVRVLSVPLGSGGDHAVIEFVRGKYWVRGVVGRLHDESSLHTPPPFETEDQAFTEAMSWAIRHDVPVVYVKRDVYP